MSEVTKPKNEGRVAAGKRLVEWNRKNKENLIKNKNQVGTSGESSKLSSEQEPAEQSTSRQVLYGGGALIIVAAAVCFFLWKRESQPKPANDKPANDKPANDIFKM